MMTRADRIFNARRDGDKDRIEFHFCNSELEVSGFRVIGDNEHDDPQTDYFAGTWFPNLKSAMDCVIRINDAAKARVIRMAEIKAVMPTDLVNLVRNIETLKAEAWKHDDLGSLDKIVGVQADVVRRHGLDVYECAKEIADVEGIWKEARIFRNAAVRHESARAHLKLVRAS